jgi:GntR family carbon starvation induced transcriptional regulator
MRNAKDGRTLNTAMFEQLREEILTGKLLPGQRLKVSLLAQTHEVSLNVVREALNRLAGEQWVEIEPQHGFTVRALSADDLIDLVRQRTLFEGIALRQAIARGDVEWQSQVVAAHHRLSRTPLALESDPTRMNPEWLARHEEFNIVMMQACGSPRLVQIVRQLSEAAAMYHRALLPAISDNHELESEHSALLEAILAGDIDRAVLVLTSHLEQTRDMMLPFLLAASVENRETPAQSSAEMPASAKPRRGRPPSASKVPAAEQPAAAKKRKIATGR